MENGLKYIVAFFCGLWSIATIAVAQPKIALVEYYIDKDPGYGNASKVAITSAVNLQNLSVNVNPASLGEGAHIFGVRAKDINGAWSLDNKWLFVKDTTLAKVPNIVSAEYYIDSDPGYGNGTKLSITSSANLQNVMININSNSLRSGAHLLGIRAKDKNGAWSQDNKWLFVKDTVLGATPDVENAEYYVDVDPGYGKATKINITSGINLQNLFVNINPASLKEGTHILGIRARDAKGAWSLDNKWLFVKDTSLGTIPDIVNAEYYIDSDPGYGNATKISIVPSTNLQNLFVNINIDSLTTGAHTFGIRARDVKGAWSLDNKWLFTVKAPLVSQLNFAAVSQNDNCLLNWKTINGINADYFIIQHSTDAINFNDINRVDASGNNTVLKDYTFTDKSPNNGINYYRLKMMDKEGNGTYSKTLPVNMMTQLPFVIYPNPVKNVLYVQIQSATAEKVSLQVIDAQGKTVLQQNYQLKEGITTLSIATASLDNGTYSVYVKGKDAWSRMFVKE